MIGNQPSATRPVDVDAVLQSHPADELSINRSRAKYFINSADTEDDELQKEVIKLSSTEREVSQEISELVRLFSNRSEKQSERIVDEEGPRKLNSPVSPMNEIYTEWVMKRENKYVFQEQLALTNQKTIRLRNNKKTHDSEYISNIHEVGINRIVKDTRESPGRSQPSDEESTEILGVCSREPPEEILFADDDESSSDDDVANAFEEVLNHTNTHFRESKSASETQEIALSYDLECADESTFVERNGKDAKVSVVSEWGLRSGQQTDLEKGGNNLFEKETFWEGNFWKDPVYEFVPQNPSRLVQQEELNKCVASGIRKPLHISQSRRAIIDKLSVPTLDHQEDKNLEDHTEANYQSIGSRPEKANKDFVEILSVKSDAHRNITHSRESMETTRSLSWQLAQIPSYEIEDQFTAHTQKPENRHSFAFYIAVPNEREGMVTLNKERSRHRNDFCNWRIIVLVVQVILTVIGVAVFWHFLRSKNSQTQMPYTYHAPDNDNCSVAVEVIHPTKSKQFSIPAIITEGTTFGATKEKNPCNMHLDHVGVWFIITGTGGWMTTSSQTDSVTDIHLSILLGQCNNLVCVSTNDRRRYNAEKSSWTWASIAGESYYILVHGEASLAGNFSLSLSEATSRDDIEIYGM